MTAGSTREFILATIRAGSPARAREASFSISPRILSWRANGATANRFHCGGRGGGGEPLPLRRLGVAGEEVEERGGVVGELFARGEDGDVGVLPGSARIVVAG